MRKKRNSTLQRIASKAWHASVAIQVAPDPSLASRNYNNRGYAKYLIAESESADGNFAKAKELDPDIENKP